MIPPRPRFLPGSGLNLVISDRPKRVRLSVSFDPDYYDPDAIRALLSHWAGILEEMVEEPARRLSEPAPRGPA
jgi:hypothetical protein